MKLREEIKFYLTDWEPNGTQVLIITDGNNQVIESINEACFGAPTPKYDVTGGISVCYYGESVGYLYDSADTFVSYDVFPVREVTLDTVLKYIAVSPVSDGSEVISVLNKYSRSEK